MTSRNELGAELVGQGEQRGSTGATQRAAAIFARDRRRIRWLSIATIAFWFMAALLIPSILMPMWAKIKMHVPPESLRETGGKITPEMAIYSAALLTTAVAAISTIASLLAAICTVWLVLTVRRSTLSQISAGLAEISDQLRQLQPRSPKISGRDS